jgi:hypothetical protein
MRDFPGVMQALLAVLWGHRFRSSISLQGWNCTIVLSLTEDGKGPASAPVAHDPGHAESNLRNTPLTANNSTDNFEEAASTTLDYLVQRTVIDTVPIGVYSICLPSLGGLRFAARDRRPSFPLLVNDDMNVAGKGHQEAHARPQERIWWSMLSDCPVGSAKSDLWRRSR